MVNRAALIFPTFFPNASLAIRLAYLLCLIATQLLQFATLYLVMETTLTDQETVCFGSASPLVKHSTN